MSELKEARERAGLTIEELAEGLWEQGWTGDPEIIRGREEGRIPFTQGYADDVRIVCKIFGRVST